MEKYIEKLNTMRKHASVYLPEGKLCTKLETLSQQFFNFSCSHETFSFFMATHAIKIAKKVNLRTKKIPAGYDEYHNHFMMEIMNNMVFFHDNSEWYRSLHDRVWDENNYTKNLMEFIDCAYEWCKEELLPDGADGVEECYAQYEKLCQELGI